MAPCRLILAEMEKHEDAWPFLVPVNAKQVHTTILLVMIINIETRYRDLAKQYSLLSRPLEEMGARKNARAPKRLLRRLDTIWVCHIEKFVNLLPLPYILKAQCMR